MSAGGKLTAEIGARLEEWLSPMGYEVLFDHGGGSENIGNIVSWFGTAAAPTLETELSQVDIAVVSRSPDGPRACALIEIEESSDRPKNVIGDLMAVLMGDHVSFRLQKLAIDERTALILMARGPLAHWPRMRELVEHVRAAQPHLVSGNARLGTVAGELYGDVTELASKLMYLVEEAVRR
ncbi:MAG TPA: hypothetical protein VIU40_01015 [Geobacteraceae bacterium]